LSRGVPGSVSSSLETQFNAASPAIQATNVIPAAIATLAKSSNEAQEIAVTKAVATTEKMSIDLSVEKALFLAIALLPSIRW
jgi:hypothetical protein